MYLEHANITVSSIEKTCAFLAAAFPDFQLRGEGDMFGDPALGRWVHFGSDDTYLALQQVRDGVGRQNRTYSDVGTNHLGFVVDDVQAVIKRLEAAGYELSSASSLGEHPHRERAYFYDDCGFEWEFVQYLSDQPDERNDYKL